MNDIYIKLPVIHKSHWSQYRELLLVPIKLQPQLPVYNQIHKLPMHVNNRSTQQTAGEQHSTQNSN